MASVLHTFRRAVRSNPASLASISFSKARGSSTFITYAELEEEVHRVASGLLRHVEGIQHKGDRLVMLCRNHDTALVYLYVAPLLGLTLVPLNYRWTPREIAHAVRDCGARVVVVDKDLIELLGEVAQGDLEAVVALLHDCSAPVTGLPKDTKLLLHDNLIHPPSTTTTTPLHDEGRDTSSEDLHCLLYTSGTSGAPKAVMITHLNQVVQALEKCVVVGYGPHTVYLNLAPLFHIGGLNSTLAVTMAGGTHVFIEGGLEVETALDAIDLHEVNTLVVVPAILQALLSSPSLPPTTTLTTPPDGMAPSHHPRRSLRSIQTVLVGGQMLPPKLRVRAETLFPWATLIQTYACSEACSSISFLVLPTRQQQGKKGEDHPITGDAVGKAAHHCEVAIAGEKKPGEVGEIVTRGPHVMKGYWGKPDLTRHALRGGWLHTGDLGYLDRHGVLYLVGRLNEVIRSGGESIHPPHVEKVLEEHPHVAEAAVFGMPDDKFGERVTAAVVLKGGVISDCDNKTKAELEKEMVEHCRRRLSKYECPKQVIIMPGLPKNGSGKVIKSELRSSL